MKLKIVAWVLIIWIISRAMSGVLGLLIKMNWLVTFSDWVIAIIILLFSGFGWFMMLKWAFREINK